MRAVLRLTATWVLVAGVLATTHWAHLVTVGLAQTAETESRFFLPDGPALRRFSLRQETSLADLYWLRLVQYIGTPEHHQQKLPQLYPLANLVTDLDPRYAYAYLAPGMLLSTTGRIQESNHLLEKGVSNAPWRWEIPFYLSFNHWYELRNLEEGARWLKVAATVKGAPPWIGTLINRLYSSAGQIDLAIGYTKQMYEQAISEGQRADLGRRLEDLDTERTLQQLEAACATFRERFGRPPWTLKELVGTVLERLPEGPFEIDPLDGEPATFLLQKRIRLNRPPEPPPLMAIPVE
jgi:tetratricopeptide (TPR) repeat protein